jgi:hypothetical protein
MSIRIPVRNLINRPIDELWERLYGDFIVVFDDGEVEVNERHVIYSHYAWEFFRMFPDQPILKKHIINSIMSGRDLPADAFLKLTGAVYFSTLEQYRSRYADVRILVDRLSRMAYESTNAIYNSTVTKLLPWVKTLCITDFVKIATTKDIAESIDSMPATSEGIDSANNVIINAIKNDPRFENNPLAIAVRTGISRIGQTIQILGQVGYVEDINSRVFPIPIRSNYLKGITRFHDSLIESRLASKALFNATTPLQQSEYFSRRQQLIAMGVRNLHMCDCGSKKYINWQVREERMDGDKKIGDSDLKTIYGKYYLDEETGQLKVIKKTDTHLHGKLIKLRSPYNGGCQHPDPYGICLVCFGESGLSIPQNSNLGHAATVSMMARIAQLILSTKHFTASANIEGANLRGLEAQILKTQGNESRFFINPNMKNHTLFRFRLPVKMARGLTDVSRVDDVRRLDPARTTEFEKIGVEWGDASRISDAPINVNVNARLASFTHEMLAYIKKNGAEMVGENYIIDMTKWDYDQPVFELPMSHFNMSDHQKAIQGSLELTREEMRKRSTRASPDVMLMEFHDLVNSRLSVHLSVLEIVMYASTVISTEQGNYGHPKVFTESDSGAMRDILQKRSMGALLAFEGHRSVLVDPKTYLHTNRPDHPLDACIYPEKLNSGLH